VSSCVCLYLGLCVCVPVQLLVKDLEQMFSRPSLEVHALLVWRHYVHLLGTVSHGTVSVFRVALQCSVTVISTSLPTMLTSGKDNAISHVHLFVYCHIRTFEPAEL